MTYILGVKNKGVAAIISDTMVTFEKTDPGFHALKTGLLFPGCAYGAAGDANAFRRFVIWCKRQLDDVEETLEGFWSRFCALVNAYEFQEQSRFELLLLSRHLGSPNFYVLDSRSGKVESAGDLVTLGSGKQILDELIQTFRREEHELREQKLLADGWPAWYWPFYYCQELMTFSQGHSYDELQKHGVGGVFHYLCQTADGEYVQEAALYAVISPFESLSQISYTIYRVLFGEMALMIENGATNEAAICLDAAAYPDVENFSKAQLQELRGKILLDIKNQPHYRFAGFVFADPKYQACCFDMIRGDDAPLAFTEDGRPQPEVAHAVAQAIAMVDGGLLRKPALSGHDRV